MTCAVAPLVDVVVPMTHPVPSPFKMLGVLCWVFGSCGQNSSRPRLHSPHPKETTEAAPVNYSLFEDVLRLDGLMLRERLRL